MYMRVISPANRAILHVLIVCCFAGCAVIVKSTPDDREHAVRTSDPCREYGSDVSSAPAKSEGKFSDRVSFRCVYKVVSQTPEAAKKFADRVISSANGEANGKNKEVNAVVIKSIIDGEHLYQVPVCRVPFSIAEIEFGSHFEEVRWKCETQLSRSE